MDAYSSCFFKKAWEFVGIQFTKAVLELFSAGSLLK